MTIALITSNQALRNVLEPLFQQNNLDYLIFNTALDMKADDHFSLRIWDYESENIEKLNYKEPVFAILKDIKSISEDVLGEFTKIFEYPLRLGLFYDEIQYFLRQKLILSALNPIEMGGFCLNPKNNTFLNLKTQKEINLTEKEQSILLYLHSQGKNKAQRAELLGHVWRYAENVETHTLETHIYRLRQKIEKDPAAPEFLMTDEEGYYLNL